MKLKYISIGEIVDQEEASIQTGPFGTQLKASHYTEDGWPVINVRNVGYGDLRPEKLEFINDETRDRLSAHVLEEQDIVFGRKGAVDRHLFVQSAQSGWLQGSDCIRLRFSSPRIEPRFVSYAFLTKSHQSWMLTQSGNKATMASLNQDIIKRIEIPNFPLPIQTRIADILSTYDDLIENNKRRMQLLEEAARQLYREWFVRLRFPGHEHTKITNGLPEGWDRRPIPEFAKIVGGGTPKTTVPEYWDDGEVVWVTPTDVTRNSHFCLLDSEKKITETGLKNSSAKLVPPHSILMTSRASVGFFALIRSEVCTNQGFISIVPNDKLATPFLLLQLSERVEEIRNMGTGSTYPEVSRGKFKEFEVVMPSAKTISIFSDYTSPMFDQLWALKQQNQKLRAARDLLLPKLMNGEIAV